MKKDRFSQLGVPELNGVGGPLAGPFSIAVSTPLFHSLFSACRAAQGEHSSSSATSSQV